MWFKLKLLIILTIICHQISVGYTTPQQNVTRVYGESEAGEDVKRYQVIVRRYTNENGPRIVCGGALISKNAVLTIASEVYGWMASQFQILLGMTSLFTTSEYTLVYSVSEIIIHENYNNLTHENNLAIIKLNGNVSDTNPAIKPIELVTHETAVNTKCNVSGYGSNDLLYALTETLMTVDVLKLDATICASSNTNLYPGMICAGNSYTEDRSVCLYDRGGPLVCNGLLTGIAVTWSRCNNPLNAATYSDVYYYRDWIDAHIGSSTIIVNINLVILICSFICSRLFM